MLMPVSSYGAPTFPTFASDHVYLDVGKQSFAGDNLNFYVERLWVTRLGLGIAL